MASLHGICLSTDLEEETLKKSPARVLLTKMMSQRRKDIPGNMLNSLMQSPETTAIKLLSVTLGSLLKGENP